MAAEYSATSEHSAAEASEKEVSTKGLETGANCFSFRLFRKRDFARVAQW